MSRRKKRRTQAPAESSPPAPATVTTQPAAPAIDRAVCLICGEPMSPLMTIDCAVCRTPHHRDCFLYNGCCALFGCGSTRFLTTSTPETAVLLRMVDSGAGNAARKSAWGRLAGVVSRILSSRPVSRGLARSGEDPVENGNLKLARGQPNLGAGVFQPRAPRPRLRLGLAIDFVSPAEAASRWMAATGFLGLTAAMLLQPCPHFPPGTGLLTLLAAGICLAGLIGMLGLRDVWRFDEKGRTVRLDRTIFGFRTVRKVLRFEEFAGVGIATHPGPAGEAPPLVPWPPVRWLLLYKPDGAVVRLGDFAGYADPDILPDLRRIAGRIREVTGLAVNEGLRAPLSWRHLHATVSVARTLFWGLSASCVSALFYDLGRAWSLAGIDVAPGFLVAFAFAIGSWLLLRAHWTLITRPRGLPRIPEHSLFDRNSNLERQLAGLHITLFLLIPFLLAESVHQTIQGVAGVLRGRLYYPVTAPLIAWLVLLLLLGYSTRRCVGYVYRIAVSMGLCERPRRKD